MRDELDALRDEVKKPLIEWQEKEDKRLAVITGVINKTIQSGKEAIEGYLTADVDELFKLRTEIGAIDPENGYGEFKDRITEVCAVALDQIDSAISKKNAYDIEQLELEELRADLE